jgi:hypothetical protein
MSNSDAILDRTKPIFEEVIPFRIDQNGQRNTDLTVRILNGITVSLALTLYSKGRFQAHRTSFHTSFY